LAPFGETARASHRDGAMTRGLVLAALVCAVACHRSSSPAAPAAAPAPVAAPANHEGGGGRRAQQAGGAIEVVVNGKPAGAWTAQQLASGGAVAMTNQNGEAREGWSVKALAQSLVGAKARVVALATADERVPIDEKAWNDPSRALVLRPNHHGEYKAHWVAGGNADEAFLKGVRRIEIVQ
jgi:hypothetical protein